MKKSILSAVLFAASTGLAAAGGFGGIGGIGATGGGYVGTGGGYAQSATTGGSMAQGSVNGTGIAVQFSANEGSGYASAGSSVNPGGVDTYTTGGSNAFNVSAGFEAGNAIGATAGAVGTDFSSDAWGSFDTAGFGAGILVGGFGAFGNW